MEQYVIKTVTGKYIGIDEASGGYPFETTSIQNAQKWYSPIVAKNYYDKFPKENWELHLIPEIQTTKVNWNKSLPEK